MQPAAADALSLRRYGPRPAAQPRSLPGALAWRARWSWRLKAEGSACPGRLRDRPGARHDFEAQRAACAWCWTAPNPAGRSACSAAAPPSHAPPWRNTWPCSAAGRPLAPGPWTPLLLEAWLAGGTGTPPSPAHSPPTGGRSASANSRRRAIDWQRLRQWAAREWHQEITVADLARRVHLSPSQFTALPR